MTNINVFPLAYYLSFVDRDINVRDMGDYSTNQNILTNSCTCILIIIFKVYQH